MQTNLSELRTLMKAFSLESDIAGILHRKFSSENTAPSWRAIAFYSSIIAFVLLTDVAVLMDIPYLRQLMGFACISVLPGALILRILRLNRALPLEGRIVLSTGLSLSFLMLIGLLANWLYPILGYSSPLSTIPMVITLTSAQIVLISIAYLRDDSEFNFDLKLGSIEKALLIVSSAFPLMSILGSSLMNATGNNDILMALLFVVPAYLALIYLSRDKVSESFYPPAILFISVSLVLLLGLRSSHIIGSDIHAEYYLFQTTFNEGRWHRVFTNDLVYSPLDACLSISILPAVYQSLMNINPEMLFKTLYTLTFSVSPLVIYSLSKRYIGQLYSFLASMFFMSQLIFLTTAYNPRVVTATLFFALLVMVAFENRIRGTVKKCLFIVLSFSCILSHYTTTYILLFILTAWFCLNAILDKFGLYRTTPGLAGIQIETGAGPFMTLRALILLYAMTFFWYGQITGAAFNAGVSFVYTAIKNLNDFLVLGARGTGLSTAFGVGFLSSPLPQKISFIASWLTVILLCLGLMACIARYWIKGAPIGAGVSELLLRELNKDYFLLSLVAFGILILSVALPRVGTGYGIDRVYFQMMVVLSPFFILGSKVAANFLYARNIRRINAHAMVLIILIPYFLCNSGALYEAFDVPKAVTLSSSGQMYETTYIHDKEIYGAKWLKDNMQDAIDVYSDFYGTSRLMSQGGIPWAIYPKDFIEEGKRLGEGYFYLRYYGAVYGKLMDSKYIWHNLIGNTSDFSYRELIYSNGGSEVYL